MSLKHDGIISSEYEIIAITVALMNEISIIIARVEYVRNWLIMTIRTMDILTKGCK